MFLVMNHFKVHLHREDEFRKRWLDRETLLTTVPGFISIQFLVEEAQEDHIPYASQTLWDSRESYENWRFSNSFQTAHMKAGQGEPTTLGRRESRSYEVLKTVNSIISTNTTT